jgi:hypothetical protein
MLRLAPLTNLCRHVIEYSPRCLCSTKSGSHYKDVHLPDYDTSVDIHSHRLTRPQAPPPTPKWVGLQDLQERTKVTGMVCLRILLIEILLQIR